MVEVVFQEVVFGQVCYVAGLHGGEVGGAEEADVHFGDSGDSGDSGEERLIWEFEVVGVRGGISGTAEVS